MSFNGSVPFLDKNESDRGGNTKIEVIGLTGKIVKYMKSALIGILMILIITGCGILRPAAPKEEEGKKKNPPKALTQMEQDTDKMIQDLEDVREKRAKQEREQQHPSKEEKPRQAEQQGTQQGQQEEQGQGQQDGQQGQQSGGQQQGQGQQEQKQEPQQTPEPIPEPDWTELESMTESLHENWNTYEPKAKSDGAMSETIKSLEEQLITLTEQIMARNEEKTLVAANTLYSYYPEFLKLYSHNQPPEVKEVKSLTRQIILYGQQDKWEETKPLLEKMKPAWQEAKIKIKKPDKDLNSKIEAALYDFNYVVSAKKINLAKIKGNILINNLEQVE